MMQITNFNIALMLILAHLTITSLGMAVPSSTRTTSSSSSSNGGAKGGIASTTYDLLVVGGGSAGLTAAKFAATFGKVC
jgi:succinate dehydrogenase/fumarate reductase flavoprotein subunit